MMSNMSEKELVKKMEERTNAYKQIPHGDL